MQSGYQPCALGRGTLQISSSGVAACQRRFLPRLFSPGQPSPSRPGASSPPAGPPLRAWSAPHPSPGSYLGGVDFGVFRRRTAAQAVQKHQQQREQPSSAAQAAASAARPSGRAPVAAHALSRPAGSRALHAGLARWQALGPHTRLANLRLSLAPGFSAGARRTLGSRCPPESLGSPLQIPKPEEKRPSRLGHARNPPAGEGTGRAAHHRVSQPRRGAPWSRPPESKAQLQSLCLAQRSGRPVPRRPLRALLSVSMPKAPRAAQSARLPLVNSQSAAPKRAWIPLPGSSRRKAGNRPEGARSPPAS